MQSAAKPGKKLAAELLCRIAILWVFDKGGMEMYNAIIVDELSDSLGAFKERLSQSALVTPIQSESDAEAKEARKRLSVFIPRNGASHSTYAIRILAPPSVRPLISPVPLSSSRPAAGAFFLLSDGKLKGRAPRNRNRHTVVSRRANCHARSHMARQVDYNSSQHIAQSGTDDPYLRPAFSLGDRLARMIWSICWLLLYRPSPRPFHAWRAMLLRIFGASLGPNCHFYPASRIWAPWKLSCADQVTVGDGAEIYNPATITFGSHAILSQGAYLCGATHDFDDPAFPLLAYSMTIGAYAWVCARASIAPGVNMGEGAVLGLASVATHNLDAWGVYAGVPARKVKERKQPKAGN